MSSKAPNQDLKGMVILCTFKIKVESQNLDQGTKKTTDQIKIKIKMPNPSKETPVSSKAPSQDLEDMNVSLHLQSQERDRKFRS